MNPRPCSATEAVARARKLLADPMLANAVRSYELGTGDYRPPPAIDVPWTDRAGVYGSDCAGFAICWCYQLPRHRPGLNDGVAAATIADDINVDALIEDARVGAHDLGDIVTVPQAGDLLLYPTIKLANEPGKSWMGHVGIVLDASTWGGTWTSLRVAQCCGPNGRAPAVLETDGYTWAKHDTLWPKPEHRSVLVRMRA